MRPVNEFAIEAEQLHKSYKDVVALAGNSVWGAFAWCDGLIAVFAAWCVTRYRRAVAS
jgi:hypothetical protein